MIHRPNPLPWVRLALAAAALPWAAGCLSVITPPQTGAASTASSARPPSAPQLYFEAANSETAYFSFYAPGSLAGQTLISQSAFGASSLAGASSAALSASQSAETGGSFYFGDAGGLEAGAAYWLGLRLSGDGGGSWSGVSNIVQFTTGFGQAGYLGAGHDGWQTLNNRQIMPYSVRVGPQGILYITDFYGHRVVRMSAAGDYLGWIGSGLSGWQMGGESVPGTGDAYFQNPADLVFDPSQPLMYVVDASNNRVQKWTLAGQYQGWIGGGSDGWKTGAAPASGSGDRQFNFPFNVNIDPSGNLWVDDMENWRYQKWSLSGTYAGWIGGGTSGLKTGAAPAHGGADAEFSYSYGLAFDSASNLYIADLGNYRVQKWSSSLAYVGWIGGGSPGWKTGAAPAWVAGQPDYNLYPYDVRVDASGNLYIAGDSTVQKWTSSGTLVGRSGNGSQGWVTGMTNVTEGSADMYQNESSGLDLDSSGNIYVADSCNGRVVELSPAGEYLGWIGGGLSGLQHGVGMTILDYEGEPRSFASLVDVALDAGGNFYVTDYYNNLVTLWNAEGAYQGSIGGGTSGWKMTPGYAGGSGDKFFSSPSGVAVDASGNVYVADTGNARVQKWSSSGAYVGWIGGGSSGWKTGAAPAAAAGNAAFSSPLGLLVVGATLYVSDAGNNRIQQWSIAGGAGTYVGWIGGGSNGWKTGAAPAAASGDAQFSSPAGIATDGLGNLYVVDKANSRVQQWGLSGGTYAGWIGGGSSGWKTGAAPASGAGDAQFSFSNTYAELSHAAVDPNASALYITDSGNGRLQKWDLNGTYVGWTGRGVAGWSQGTPSSAFANNLANETGVGLSGLAVGPDGTVYTSDLYQGRLMRWK